LRRIRVGTRQLQQRIEEDDTVLVHSTTSAVWGGAFAARRTKTPDLWHVHEIVTQPTVVKNLMAWMIARYSDHIVAISHAVADHLLADQPQLEPRLSVIYDAVDTERFSPDIDGAALRNEWGILPDDVLVGVVGRISAWKGQLMFLEAFVQAQAKTPNLRAVIVGDAPPNEDWRVEVLKVWAQDQGIGERVIWAGYRNDSPQVMAALDILALPSIQPEPFGMAILEAMATGKSVIATAHGGPLETVVEGETGYLVSATDPSELASALQTLSTNASLRQKLGTQARQRVKQEFSFTTQIDAFETLYENLIRK
jgi:glycosyltransferase involved in cell wall biosynthesis